MLTLSRCGVVVSALLLAPLAHAGVQVTSASGRAVATSSLRSAEGDFAEHKGGDLASPIGGVDETFNAAAFLTCGDAASATSYTHFIATPTSLRLDGYAASTTVTTGVATQLHAAADARLSITFRVDRATAWKFRYAWTGESDGGEASIILRRAGSMISIFDRAADNWETAKGVLPAGDYELYMSCTAAAEIAQPDPDTSFQWHGSEGYLNLMLDLVDSPTAPAAADFNLDGFVDFTDFDDFVTAFERGEAATDFNADGFIDFTDFDAFVAAFDGRTGG
ncbi:MAG: hypothetical protein SFY96_00350 [Planctomycetota bacterium]|nr:hypothetical protein [Planctomycetota bacterium]